MHARVYAATPIGVQAQQVIVEVDLALGLLNFHIVGLPDVAIKESRQRIGTALKNAGITIPDRKITVNLAPADLKKEGTLFDLPIAVGIMQAAGVIRLPQSFWEETIFVGELLLDGSVHRIHGALAIAHGALHRLGKKRIVVPQENAPEAAAIAGLEVIPVSHLAELVNMLRQDISRYAIATTPIATEVDQRLDFEQVQGQHQAKRALQIAAAGRHHLLFVGSPGSGKTMLAERLPGLLSPLRANEVLETSAIYSVSGKLTGFNLITTRPFRAPHHTISQAGLIGGGSWPQPGETSLAHHGVLFLDELTEFKRSVIESLRQPLEQNAVRIARAQQTIEFPASFLLVGAMNPCPCGFLTDQQRRCTCAPQEINRYLAKISGPLLDRIDLQVAVPSLSYQTLKAKDQQPLSTAQLRVAVERARNKQKERFGCEDFYNGMMGAEQVKKYCIVETSAETVIESAFSRLNLSMRGYHKILKVARTIADLDGAEIIQSVHLYEAISYRSLEQSLERSKQAVAN